MSLQLVLSHRFKKELNEKCSAASRAALHFLLSLF